MGIRCYSNFYIGRFHSFHNIIYFTEGNHEITIVQFIVCSVFYTGGGVFLAPASDGFSQGETFRQLDDFWYFTGLELPNSMLAIDADDNQTVLFVPRQDARFENPSRPNDFPGRALASDPALSRASHIADIRAVDEMSDALSAWHASGRIMWIDTGRAEATESIEDAPISARSPGQILVRHILHRHPSARMQNAHSQIARLRMVKSPEEIGVIRRAVAITADGIRHAAVERHARPVDATGGVGKLNGALQSRRRVDAFVAVLREQLLATGPVDRSKAPGVQIERVKRRRMRGEGLCGREHLALDTRLGYGSFFHGVEGFSGFAVQQEHEAHLGGL